MCVATYLTKTDRDSWKCFLTMCCTIYFGFFSWLHPSVSVSVSQTSLVVNLMTRLVQTVVWHDFSILGMNLFGCKFRQDDATIIGLQPVGPHRVRHRKNFDNLLWAIITVFQVNDCQILKLALAVPVDSGVYTATTTFCRCWRLADLYVYCMYFTL